jgi:hypothetical protein
VGTAHHDDDKWAGNKSRGQQNDTTEKETKSKDTKSFWDSEGGTRGGVCMRSHYSSQISFCGGVLEPMITCGRVFWSGDLSFLGNKLSWGEWMDGAKQFLVLDRPINNAPYSRLGLDKPKPRLVVWEPAPKKTQQGKGYGRGFTSERSGVGARG